MSQEFYENKEVNLSSLSISSGRRLLRVGLMIVVFFFSCWLMVVLLSFDPSDPSWSQTAWHEPIHNFGGVQGAWLSDMLFFIFGVIAYIIPLIAISSCCWLAWRQRQNSYYYCCIDYFAVSRRLLGSLVLILTSCGLAAINVDDIWYFSSGGIIGNLLSTALLTKLHSSGSNIVLLCVWIAGLTLLTSCSFLVSIAEKTGSIALTILTFVSNCTRRDDTWFDEEEYDNKKEEISLLASQPHRELSYTKLLRSLTPPRRRVTYKFSNQLLGCKPDAALFSGKRIYYDEQDFYGASSCSKETTNPGNSSISRPLVVSAASTESSTTTTQAADYKKCGSFHQLLIHNNNEHHQRQEPNTMLPSLVLLTPPAEKEEPIDPLALEQMARLVEARLADFRIKADVVHCSLGPVITRFELKLAPGVKAARISNLSRDLARSLSTISVRVEEVIPGKPYVGLELPNKKRQTIYLRELLCDTKFRDNPSPLTVVLGKDITGDTVVADLSKMPHLLVAGTTGSGKSVGINAMIMSLLYKAQPEDVRIIMIDPKMLELSMYEGIPHLLTKVVTDMTDAANVLHWSVNEMERRYKLMSALGVRNIDGYNEKIVATVRMGRSITDSIWMDKKDKGSTTDAQHLVLKKLPYIVVFVDELSDLMMTVGKKAEELIIRLAQKARAAGIHMVLATQRPSVDVITGLIKANIPTRIAFHVSSKIDSYTILDQSGAELLLGMGDMLYSSPNSTIPVRVHGAFVFDQEVQAVVQDWKARCRSCYRS